MACGPIVQIFNLVLLILLAGAAIVAEWSSITSFTFSSDIAAMAQTWGAACSGVAILVFANTWAIGGEVMGWIACVFALLDVAAYAIWSWKGSEGLLCTGLQTLIGKASTSLSGDVTCSAQWVQWVEWGVLTVSGSLQLSTAFSAVSCLGGGSSNSLGKARRAQSSTSAAGGTAVARSLGRRRSGRTGSLSRRPGSLSSSVGRSSESDLENGTREFGGHDGWEEKKAAGRGGRKGGLGRTAGGPGLSDEERDMVGRRSG
ncbi:hypothetical protein JCM8097_007202 [Rhodosporidiobolus ruineniae]